jgi:aryl-alcohol dehydrogenase-like predicted oxidoreductase
MDYRSLGHSGLKVSPLCLGTMMFGEPTSEATALRIMDRAREQGINFIDTADAYNEGLSEEIVGRGVAANRGWWIVATKICSPTEAGPNGGGLSRHHMFRAIEGNLRRLRIDAIDILYFHRPDKTTPMSETIHALSDLVRQGKVRNFGLSNHRAWQIAEICHLCDRAGIDRPIISQPYYNALNRTPEVEHLPACAHLGLGVFPYSPLARGVLTGKYLPGVAPSEDTRAGRRDKRMLETEWRAESLEIARQLAEHARALAITPGQFALAWLLNTRLITGAVVGPRTEEQWEDYFGALQYRYTPEDEALVDRLVTPGHSSTPGYNDPAYPIEGRQSVA